MSLPGPVGMVLSGGGANGAYEVGVMKALVSGASPATGFTPIDPEVYAGTSVGAYNSTFLCSRPTQPASAVVAELEQTWLERIANTLRKCGNGVYRVRGAPLQGLDPGCVTHPLQSSLELARDSVDLAGFGLAKAAQFLTSKASLQERTLALFSFDVFISASPFERLVGDTLSLESLARSPKRLTIAASNWRDGLLRLFSKAQLVNEVGTSAVLASAALPGIFPAVNIQGTPFVDGGVLQNSPFKPAIREGANTLHVVFLDPLVSAIPIGRLPSTLDTFYRLFAVLWAAQVRNDLKTCLTINRALLRLNGGSSPPHPADSEESLGLVAALRLVERLVSRRPYRLLDVHVYRPASDLGGGEGLLDFQQHRLAKLIQMGYDDAVRHNCAESGCILAREAA